MDSFHRATPLISARLLKIGIMVFRSGVSGIQNEHSGDISSIRISKVRKTTGFHGDRKYTVVKVSCLCFENVCCNNFHEASFSEYSEK